MRCKIRKVKCTFLSPSVDFLNHRFDAEGYHPMGKSSKVLSKPQYPRISKKSFLELLNYY